MYGQITEGGGGGEMFVLNLKQISQILMVSDKIIHKAFRIHNTIQGGPERMQHLQSLISKKADTKSNWWVH